MSLPNRERNQAMAGQVDKAKGRAKEAIGRAVGNKSLEREGKRDRMMGEVKDKAHKVKKTVERKIDDTLDAIEDENR
jgi:uncharacterized protein YjbJ (UPF0337 family)